MKGSVLVKGCKNDQLFFGPKLSETNTYSESHVEAVKNC